MERLNMGVRNTDLHFDRRAIIPINKVLEIVNEAHKEGIKSYMLVYAYNEGLYSVGYEEGNELIYNYGMPDGQVLKFNSSDELLNYCKYDKNVTVLREFQDYLYNGMTEISIKDNYLLKDFLIDETNPNYNYNLNQELIEMLNNLKEEGAKDSKKTAIFLIGCVVFIIAVIIFAAIFGNQ